MIALAHVLSAVAVAGADAPAGSDRNASYAIDVRLDGRALRGRATVTWRNAAARPTGELHFHLYLNAFRGRDTPWMRQARHAGFDLDWLDDEPDPWGRVDVRAVRVGGRALATRAGEDATVLIATLPAPAPPGATLRVEVEFSARLPRPIARTGCWRDYCMVAQWFPKLGVLEEDGRWNCPPFAPQSEFFADFGVYDVRLDVPAGLVVGATGVRVAREPRGDRVVLHHRAEDVHDFAWFFAPWLRTRAARAARAGRAGEVDVTVFYPPGEGRQADRHLRAALHALDHYGRRLFPYPYPVLTVLVPPRQATETGAMEYPTLFSTAGHWALPRGVRLPEFITVHEHGHQYFQGLLASDEFAEAYLDEGVNQFTNLDALAALVGPRAIDLFGVRQTWLGMYRAGYRAAPDWDPAAQPGRRFVSWDSYGAVSYDKTALALQTLAGLIGRAPVAAGLRAYALRHRFSHPRGADLRAALEEAAGRRLDWFFDPVLGTTATLDHEAVEATWDEDVDESVVLVRRRGDLAFPVDVEVRFSAGPPAREAWPAAERWRRFVYPGREVVAARVDPDARIALDLDPIDDAVAAEPDHRPARRVAATWQLAIQTLWQVLGL